MSNPTPPEFPLRDESPWHPREADGVAFRILPCEARAKAAETVGLQVDTALLGDADSEDAQALADRRANTSFWLILDSPPAEEGEKDDGRRRHVRLRWYWP
jgi:hypothetical protein